MRTPPDSTFALLRLAADEAGDHPYLRISNQVFSFGDAFDLVTAVAAGLQTLGIAKGDRVGIMAGNHPETVWAWLGANALGAIDVPFNTEARGQFLAYLVADAAPRVLIGTPDHLRTLAASIDHVPDLVVVIGDSGELPFGDLTRHLSFKGLLELGSERSELPDPAPGDIATIMYTSGTTGASKGVMLPQRYYPTFGARGVAVTGLQTGEVAYCVQPLFHIDARVYVQVALAARATTALGRRFSASNFWAEVRHHRADLFGCIGTMLMLLYKQPPADDDAKHPARLAASSSTPAEIHRDFERRFGVEVLEAYGMTESVYLTATRRSARRPRNIGEPIPEVEIELFDDEDNPVQPGTAGELCFRPKQPFVTMQGYWRKPEATVEAWRNLWFHSGDFVRRHADGGFEYIGRKKDAIRRRGENVSAWEVEQAVTTHPDVREAAAIGVPSEVGEEDVAVLVVPRPGADLEPAALREFVSTDLARFAVPRYIEFVDELPKTPSERIAKGEVRRRGLTASAWDADAAASKT